MKNKTSKALIKLITLFPIGFIVSFLVTEFETQALTTHIIWGVIGSFYIVFMNWFEYEKLDNIGINDFLESKHSVIIENNTENWKKINGILNQQINVATLSKTDAFLKVLIERNLDSSIITIKKTGLKIEITIRRKYLRIVPDLADNYKTLKKLTESI
jgi:hypothetical protein